MRTRLHLPLTLAAAAAAAAAALLAACHQGPPPDFAPDPGLVARIRRIEISAPASACPGRSFAVTYNAVLDDGSRVLFDTRYDKNHPPPLHVVFLDRSSPDATPLEGGGWAPAADPLASVMDGFTLVATLRAKPTVSDTVVLPPDYSCAPHVFSFEGAPGRNDEPGTDGPPVTVRIGTARSPYYPKLIVAGIEVADQPPFYVLADATAIPPADWLEIESRGGRGGRGTRGAAGRNGSDGTAGCPGGPGGAGGNGGNGGPGGAGGRGGPVTVVAPSNLPYLAGLVDATSPGGRGGPGGDGGAAGKGGKGGAGTMDAANRRCSDGAAGPDGQAGVAGRDGPPGDPGPRPQVVTAAPADLFGPYAPAVLRELVAGRHARSR